MKQFQCSPAVFLSHLQLRPQGERSKYPNNNNNTNYQAKSNLFVGRVASVVLRNLTAQWAVRKMTKEEWNYAPGSKIQWPAHTKITYTTPNITI